MAWKNEYLSQPSGNVPQWHLAPATARAVGAEPRALSRSPAILFPVSFTPVPFTPLVANGHALTLFAWGRPRQFLRLPEAVPRLFRVAPDAQVLAHCHWHPGREAHPAILLLHGLEGSSSAHYMRGLADKAWAAGWNVVRLNQRNCGGTEHLSRGLYHSGLTGDPLAVLRELLEVDGIRALAVAGYSLGGNLALKLAGDLGDEAPS
ncbi:MAG: alpha/beta fold hydrolase, partial [Acidimicrobiia bacterium]|nr:alpha/beta fold hydrolase [Acidimicrobiia bacterium]